MSNFVRKILKIAEKKNRLLEPACVGLGSSERRGLPVPIWQSRGLRLRYFCCICNVQSTEI
jgi:hypothetical protein